MKNQMGDYFLIGWWWELGTRGAFGPYVGDVQIFISAATFTHLGPAHFAGFAPVVLRYCNFHHKSFILDSVDCSCFDLFFLDTPNIFVPL